jgi:8-oxo-dGTP pyrophosphatase MutT (NUDIX family)
VATIEQLRAALAGRRPFRMPLSGMMKQAAVAAIARDAPGGLELLFIRRADRDGDPWSGHVACPGGRVERADPSAEAAAVRETHEEIGLDLRAAAQPLGELADVIAHAHGKPLPLVIRPFVFALPADPPPELSLRGDEVLEVLWIPADFLQDRANRGVLPWRVAGVPIELPCYRWEGHVLWGLTLKMVDELLSLLV